MGKRSERRGAALLIAVAILAILFVITLAFYSASRSDLRIATNKRDTVQTQFVADAGLAIAQAFLQHDWLVHPTFTSLDHAWRTYFNGAWYARKRWAWEGGVRPRDGGIPRITYDQLDALDGAVDGRVGAFDDIFIPRVNGGVGPPTRADILADSASYPFVVPYPDPADDPDPEPEVLPGSAPTIYHAAAIDQWADVDLDDDGLRDAVWIPIPADLTFENDGIDNDLDGTIDEPGELGLFIYYGGNDGLDNDGDGEIDEPDEDALFLTARFYDQDGNDLTGQFTYPSPPRPFRGVDQLDNDYSLIVNDSAGFIYPDPSPALPTQDQLNREYHRVDAARYFPSLAGNILTFTGEPVCEVAGRVAVLITDEAGKVNLNVAHGLSYREQWDWDPGAPEPALRRALGDALGPHEYDARVLPAIGVALSNRIATLRTGAPGGVGFRVDAVPAPAGPLDYDLSLPGYGLVDDNGDAFWRAFSGLDDDANGFIDDGIYLYDYDGDGTPELGMFEGIDSPQELRMFRSFRHELAEANAVDDDGDGAVDEIGELGDRFYQTREQVKLVSGIAGATFTSFRNLASVHSHDRNDRYKQLDEAGNAMEPPELSGLKLDFNYATPWQVANTLITDWAYLPFQLDPLSFPADVRQFFVGLRQEAAAYFGTPLGDLPNDLELRAYQIGVNIEDNRDFDHARSTFSLDSEDPWGRDAGLQSAITYVAAGVESIRINEIMVRPTRRIEAEMSMNPGNTEFYANQFSRLGVPDFDMVWSPVPRGDPALGFPFIIGAKNGIADFGNNAESPPPATGAAVPIDPDHTAFPAPPAGPPVWYSNAVNPPLDVLPLDSRGTPRAPAISVLGRLFDAQLLPPPNPPPGPPAHIGSESYVSFKALVTDETGTLNNNNTPVSVTSVAIQDGPADPVSGNIPWHEVPYMVQFRFGPGPGLPPGRYYLLANVTKNGNADTTTVPKGQEDKLRYVIKYGDFANDILSDIVTGTPDGFMDFLGDAEENENLLPPYDFVRAGVLARQPIVGTRDVPTSVDPDGEVETGWVFLSSSATPPTGAVPDMPNVAGYGVNLGEPFQDAFYAYTVVIPEYNPAAQQYLYVAVWKNEEYYPDGVDNDGDGLIDEFDEWDLAINFFEFSQEPDHEWVEVVNIAESGAPIELSGWQLQVGLPGGVTVEDDHRLFTVPNGTFIAPGGSLLLAVNKYDVGAGEFDNDDGWPTDYGRLYRNGIGLCAAHPDDGVFPMFGVPETATGIPRLAESVTVPPFPTIDPLTNLPIGESVFYRRPVVVDPGPPVLYGEDFVDRDGDGILEVGTEDDLVESGPLQLPPPPSYAGPVFEGKRKPWDRIVQLESEEFARFSVGTTSPDAVATIVLKGGVFPNSPEEDYIDNDGDAAVLAGDGIDNDGDGLVDLADWVDLNGNGLIDPGECFEGMDEGGPRIAEKRTGLSPAPLSGFLPVVPGGFDDDIVDYGVDPLGAPIPIPGGVAGSPGDPPEWKEFVERRFFPGDCVIVTLYEGPASEGRIADRVTYTQRDVENRSTVDYLVCPYTDELGGPATLRPDYADMWPDNTMAVDFYRSLERKHPLYTGDRFGTQNRWQATDGNYDDWDSGQGPVFVDAVVGPIWWDYFYVHPDPGIGTVFPYAHSVSASPLRMNFFQRAMEDVPPEFPHDALRIDSAVPDWHLERDNVRNRPYSSPGELARLPHFSMTDELIAAGPGVLSTENADQVLLGRASPDALRDVDALLTSGTNSVIMLTCAQADFYTISPTPGDITADPTLVQWDKATDLYPHAWTPLFLYSLDPTLEESPGTMAPFGATAAPVELNFLFPPPAWVPTGFADVADYHARLRERWPIGRRAVMYVAANEALFEPGLAPAPHPNSTAPREPAEALFVWNAEDGVENGEYDVYVATLDNLDRLRNLPPEHRTVLFGLTDPPNSRFDGQALLNAPTLGGHMGVDVEFFTDRNGNRQCWQGSQFPDAASLDRERAVESFGMAYAAQPDTQGLVYYGAVRIENNYLAVFLRNWAKGHMLNRFSRVILVAKPRTPGRVNLNTVITRVEGGKIFNTLTGIPGLLAYNFNFDPVTNTFTFTYPPETNSLGAADPYYVAALALARGIEDTRPQAVDGRYYRLPSELITLGLNDAEDPELSWPGRLVYDVGVNPTAEGQYEEKTFRYSRMANLMTTRSDVFEVVVLAQSGHLSNVDLNGDNRIDYRNDFVVRGEKKIRTVYER